MLSNKEKQIRNLIDGIRNAPEYRHLSLSRSQAVLLALTALSKNIKGFDLQGNLAKAEMDVVQAPKSSAGEALCMRIGGTVSNGYCVWKKSEISPTGREVEMDMKKKLSELTEADL